MKKQAKRVLAELRETLDKLDLDAVEREIDELSAGRVQAWRAKPAPARSADTPIPMRDAYDLWLERHAANLADELRESLAHALEALTESHRIRATMPLELAQDFVAAEAGHPRCVVCGSQVNRSKGERYSASRCHADYEYRRRHGHDTPRSVWQARVERTDARAA